MALIKLNITLSHNELLDQAMKGFFEHMKKTTGLRKVELNLECNEFTHSTIEAFPESISKSSIEVINIDLTNNRINETDFIRIIQQYKDFRSYNYLWLDVSENRFTHLNETAGYIEEFQKEIKNLLEQN